MIKGLQGQRIFIARDAPFRRGRPLLVSLATGQVFGPPPTQAAPGRGGYPGLSAYPRAGPPHPCEPSVNVPRGSRRACPGSLRFPDPLPPTEVDTGGSGRPWQSVGRRLVAVGVTGVHEDDAWVEPDFASRGVAKGRKLKHSSGAYWRYSHISGFPRIFGFPDFPIFQVSTV